MRSHRDYDPRVLRMTLYRWKHSRLSVTLSKRGIEPLRLCNTVYLRARRTSVSGVNPNGRQKMPAFFEGMGMSFDTAVLRSTCYQ